MTALEDHHCRAVARELTAAAGYPLRDRYGYAASDEDVDKVLAIIRNHPGQPHAAADAISRANLTHEIELAEGSDTPISEEAELGIVRALRPLIEQRRQATRSKPPEATSPH